MSQEKSTTSYISSTLPNSSERDIIRQKLRDFVIRRKNNYIKVLKKSLEKQDEILKTQSIQNLSVCLQPKQQNGISHCMLMNYTMPESSALKKSSQQLSKVKNRFRTLSYSSSLQSIQTLHKIRENTQNYDRRIMQLAETYNSKKQTDSKQQQIVENQDANSVASKQNQHLRKIYYQMFSIMKPSFLNETFCSKSLLAECPNKIISLNFQHVKEKREKTEDNSLPIQSEQKRENKSKHRDFQNCFTQKLREQDQLAKAKRQRSLTERGSWYTKH